MGTLSIRDVKSSVLRRLKAMAKAHNRSVEGEVRALIERETSQPTMAEWLAQATKLREVQSMWKPGQPTAADLIRESRDADR